MSPGPLQGRFEDRSTRKSSAWDPQFVAEDIECVVLNVAGQAGPWSGSTITIRLRVGSWKRANQPGVSHIANRGGRPGLSRRESNQSAL